MLSGVQMVTTVFAPKLRQQLCFCRGLVYLSRGGKGGTEGDGRGGREEGESRGGGKEEKVRKVLKYACPGRRLLGVWLTLRRDSLAGTEGEMFS